MVLVFPLSCYFSGVYFFGGMVSSRDPNSQVVPDLQRLGIKRSRIESPTVSRTWRIIPFPDAQCMVYLPTFG